MNLRPFALGLTVAALTFTPSKPLLYLLLGLIPGLLWLPRTWLQLDAARPPQAVLSGLSVTGLNLTAASHVIHFDRWWNPAVENQATDRAFRIGQRRNVLVHKFVCRGTLEERIDALIESKLALARDVLHGGPETLLTEMSNDEIMKLVALDVRAAAL